MISDFLEGDLINIPGKSLILAVLCGCGLERTFRIIINSIICSIILMIGFIWLVLMLRVTAAVLVPVRWYLPSGCLRNLYSESRCTLRAGPHPYPTPPHSTHPTRPDRSPGKGNLYPLHRENRENGQNNSLSQCQGKHREFGNFAKHRENAGNFVWSSCKFPDSKDQG